MSATLPFVAAGLRWLYDTEQPPGAILQHHGVTLRTGSNRGFGFVPDNSQGRPVVTVTAAGPRPGPHLKSGNPWELWALEPWELDDLVTTLTDLGASVETTWNGPPADSGSVALKRPAHPTLRATVDRYRAGCPTHVTTSCSRHGCSWYASGNALLVKPRLAGDRS